MLNSCAFIYKLFLFCLYLVKFEIRITMKTKKLLITLCITFLGIQMNAQVKVLSNGKVRIGTNNPQYGLLLL